MFEPKPPVKKGLRSSHSRRKVRFGVSHRRVVDTPAPQQPAKSAPREDKKRG